MRTLYAALLLAIALFGSQAQAAEVIHEFESVLEVMPHDGSAIVTETIVVTSEGKKIKNGIYRDIPTIVKGPLGAPMRLRFEVYSVTRDGEEIPFSTENINNGVRTYMGRKGNPIAKGRHIFQIRYQIAGAVRFFDDFDEVYWNVTGNDWDFPIGSARFRLTLPDGATVLQQAAYTGRRGEKGQDYRSYGDPRGPTFETTRTLMVREGFTVAVGFPKGFVTEPSGAQNTAALLYSNISAIIGLVGGLLLTTWFLWAWHRVGRDPEKGPLVVRYEPPEGISPAGAAFILNMGFDKKCLSAATVSLGVKGVLAIEEKPGFLSKDYSLKKIDAAPKQPLSRPEKILHKEIFADGPDMDLKGRGNKRMIAAKSAFVDALDDEFSKAHFLLNYRYMIPGALLTLVTMVFMAWYAPKPEDTGFFFVWLTGWSCAVAFLLLKVFQAWKHVLAGSKIGILPAIFYTAFSLPFVTGWFFGASEMLNALGPAATLIYVIILGLNGLFFHLMKAPTSLGRRIMDEIEGFREYLSSVEGDRLKTLGETPDETIQEFERFLPYAIALGVDAQWTSRFESDLAKAVADNHHHYSPHWYHGSSGVFSSSSLSSAMSSMTSAMSSSGSSGGGSSGGGGGGGGGGGF